MIIETNIFIDYDEQWLNFFLRNCKYRFIKFPASKKLIFVLEKFVWCEGKKVALYSESVFLVQLDV